MSDDNEQRVRERAYDLWEKEGKPDGRDAEFWERARLLETSSHAPAPVTSTPADGEVDVALADTFPASDPPSFTAEVGAGR